MPKRPAKPPSLTELRKEIDRIDEAMHKLLIERSEIIDRLVAVKKTQETGSAFRPAREADMMRRLVERHHGSLPLDTVESIWRVIIATFTYVQAPFMVHADLSAGDALMRDSARFHFGFTVPFVPHMGAAGVVQAVTASKGDLGLVPAFANTIGPGIFLQADRTIGGAEGVFERGMQWQGASLWMTMRYGPDPWVPSSFMPTLPGRLFFHRALAGPLEPAMN